jgi:hypothetical protein
MKSKVCMRTKIFSVGIIFILMFFILSCSKSDDAVPATYNITGTVTLSEPAVAGDKADSPGPTPVAGVTINLTGAGIGSTTTDASGIFRFTGRANGAYTVAPVLAGYKFSPNSWVAFVSGANVTGVSLVATADATTKHSISGTITGAGSAGATITLSGDETGTTTTNASGYYIFSNLVDGDYVVTPSRTGYTFTADHLDVALSGADSTGNNFTSAAVVIPPSTYSISGTVTGSGRAGVTINLTGTETASTLTAADGTFSFTGRATGPYTLTPVKEGFTFAPTSSAATISTADITGKDFVATANPDPTYTISGQVTGDVQYNVTITLSGAGTATTTTNATGDYSLAGLLPGSYTVTPTKTGYTFAPTHLDPTVAAADVPAQDFVATANAVTWSQADLTGTWRMNMLATGFWIDGTTPANGWRRVRVSVNSSGVVSCMSYADSTGVAACPSDFALTMTINTTTGVITQTGLYAADAGNHMTMTSNKNFAAGTGSAGYQQSLMIAQKEVPGTVYSNADIQSKSFVTHRLKVGSNNDWQYEVGSTDAAALATITDQTKPSGTTHPGVTTMTLSVDSNGIVSTSGSATSKGFMSADKKTVVLTETDTGSGTTYRLQIVQITGQTYPAGTVPAGISFNHLLGRLYNGALSFWAHATMTADSGGGLTNSNWVDSMGGSAPAGGPYTGNITSSGKLTITGMPAYHGQLSDDGMFSVGTNTSGTDPNFVYLLTVSTR